MSPTRRDVLRSLAGVAVALPVAALASALPAGHVAAAIAPQSEPEPFEVAPGVHVLDGAPLWNTVETMTIDEDPRMHPDWSWEATGYFFVHNKQTERATQRRIDIAGFVDGSMRIGVSAPDCFDKLRVGRKGRGYVAVHLAPDLANEIWRGLFAQSEDDVQPTAPLEPQPWDDDRYREGQRRIGRMQRYSRTENEIEGGDEGVSHWFRAKPSNAA